MTTRPEAGSAPRIPFIGRVFGQLVARPVATTAVVGSLAASSHVWWIHEHRIQGGFDGDEAGYLATALRFRRSLMGTGVSGLASEALHNYRTAPLVPLLSALTSAVGGINITALMVIQPVLYLLTALAVVAIVARVSSNSAALCAGIVTLGLPVNIVLARSYHLALGASLFLCVAVLALLRSRRCSSLGWMAIMGAAIGSMMISRTASIAFLPGLAAATLVSFSWTKRSVAGIGLAAVVSIGVAAPWWVTSWQSISDYLFKFGYGTGTSDLGPPSPPLRAAVRLGLAMTEIRLLLMIAVVVVVIVAVRRAPRLGLRRRLSILSDQDRDLVTIGVLVAVSGAALLTTQNVGTYLQTPLEFVFVAALVAVAGRLRGVILLRTGQYVMAVALLNIVLMSRWPIGSGVALPDTSASLMFFGGTETSQAINFTAGDHRFAPAESATDRRQAELDWAGAANDLTTALESARPPGREMVRTFFGDVRLLEAGILDLATELQQRGVSRWEAPSARSAVGDGRIPLSPRSGDFARVLVAIVVKDRDPQEGFDPAPTVEAARRIGWQVHARVPLPDGGSALVLTHPSSAG